MRRTNSYARREDRSRNGNESTCRKVRKGSPSSIADELPHGDGDVGISTVGHALGDGHQRFHGRYGLCSKSLLCAGLQGREYIGIRKA